MQFGDIGSWWSECPQTIVPPEVLVRLLGERLVVIATSRVDRRRLVTKATIKVARWIIR